MATSQMSGLDIAPSTSAPLGNDHVSMTIAAAQGADAALGDANTLTPNHPDHPLKRSFVVSIRASLGDLCLRKTKGTWSPAPEALRSMLQSKKFTDLSGSTESSGDLKSVVLHSLTMSSVQSNFDVPIGVKLTGVDNATYSLTGEAYSTIVPPQTSSTAPRTLQEDDVALGKHHPTTTHLRIAYAAHSDVSCVLFARSLRVLPQVCA